jgi:hypothetical protein
LARIGEVLETLVEALALFFLANLQLGGEPAEGEEGIGASEALVEDLAPEVLEGSLLDLQIVEVPQVVLKLLEGADGRPEVSGWVEAREEL